MQNFVILTDSGTDLSRKKAEELDVRVVDLFVNVEGRDPIPDSEMDPKELYTMLRAKQKASTAAVNIDDFMTTMEGYLKEGKDVLYLGFSSGLSSTYSAGRCAAEELAAKYPERKIYAIDTLCASLGEGLLVYVAARMRRDGADIDKVKDFVETCKLNLCHWFTVDDLFFLKRGGRVSAATAVVGTMLGIKPIMHVDNEGKLIKVGVARGRKASIDAMFDKVKETMISLKEDVSDALGAGVSKVKDLAADIKNTIFISHGDCAEDADYLAGRLKKELGIKDVFIDFVGSVIGSHSGPGTLAIFYLGTQR